MTDFPRPACFGDLAASLEPAAPLPPPTHVRFPRPACFGEADYSTITSTDELTDVEIDRGIARMIADDCADMSRRASTA